MDVLIVYGVAIWVPAVQPEDSRDRSSIRKIFLKKIYGRNVGWQVPRLVSFREEIVFQGGSSFQRKKENSKLPLEQFGQCLS